VKGPWTLHLLHSSLALSRLQLDDSKIRGGLALEGFGTGYFTLAQLAELPLDEVRLHETFTARLTDGPMLVRAGVELVHALGVRAAAEGLHTQELVDAALRVRCHCGQDSYFSRPLSADEVLPWLEGLYVQH